MIEQDKLEKLTENLNKYVKTNFELILNSQKLVNFLFL